MPDDLNPAELYEALSSGAISRRAFIARLTAFGVTGAVAVAYANTVGRDSVAAHADGTISDSGQENRLYGISHLYNRPQP